MATKHELTQAYNRLLATFAQHARCAAPAGHPRTAQLYADTIQALEQARTEVLTLHAQTECRHAAKIHAQLQTPHGAYDHPTQ